MKVNLKSMWLNDMVRNSRDLVPGSYDLNNSIL